MRIHHIAIWTNQIEPMAAFYCNWFGCATNQGYHNPAKNFTSKFIYFDDGTSIELMHHPDLIGITNQEKRVGFAHLAISVRTRQKVDELTAQMASDGVKLISQPRVTGDGFYESIVADPDGNWIEITA